MPLVAKAGGDDDFGAWLELGASKNLPRNFSVGLEGELRTQDGFGQMNRATVGLNLGYKLNKWVKFRAGYSLIESYSPSQRKEHYKENDDGTLKLDPEGAPIWNGYNVTKSYWAPKHRFTIEATGTVKLWKWLRISLRERYQFTRRPEREVSKEKYRFSQAMDGEGNLVYELKDDYPMTEPDVKEAKSEHVLRSRLKFEVDKKRLAWSPFVSLETHNDLGNGLELQKLRASAGTEYKISSQHSVSLAYVFTQDLEGQVHDRMHAVSVGYGFEF